MLSVVIAVAVVSLFAVFFVYAAQRMRKGGGSMTTIALGATDEFLTTDRSKAAEVIVERKAGKEEESQSSHDPKEPDEDSSR
jgi:hypothetical protein